MGHDLDDQELEVTRNKFKKFYNLQKLQKAVLKSKHEIKRDIKIDTLKDKIEKSNKYVLYVDYHDILDLIDIVEELKEENKELKKENNEIWQHLPRLD